MRYSHQRQLVYDALCQTKSHPDANWVYNEVKTVMPHISLGTVYRNLSELCENGQVKRISAVGNVDRYDADISNHTHLICKSCGKIFDAEPCEVQVANIDFAVENCEVMIYGKCAECAKGDN